MLEYESSEARYFRKLATCEMTLRAESDQLISRHRDNRSSGMAPRVGMQISEMERGRVTMLFIAYYLVYHTNNPRFEMSSPE